WRKNALSLVHRRLVWLWLRQRRRQRSVWRWAHDGADSRHASGPSRPRPARQSPAWPFAFSAENLSALTMELKQISQRNGAGLVPGRLLALLFAAEWPIFGGQNGKKSIDGAVVANTRMAAPVQMARPVAEGRRRISGLANRLEPGKVIASPSAFNLSFSASPGIRYTHGISHGQ